MRKLGTFSTALGFIFLGVWMILRSINMEASNQLFKIWPIVIVILGIEILIYFSRKNIEERVRFNYLFVLVVFIFIIINAVTYVQSIIPYGENWFKTNFNFQIGDTIKNLNFNDDKRIATKKSFEAAGKTLYFTTNNGKITIRKSEDKNITIDATVYVNRNSSVSSYNINEQKIDDGYKVEINDDFVRGVEGVISIPDGYNINLNGSNITFKNQDELPNSQLDLKYDNGTAELKNISRVNITCDNGTIKGKDLNSITYKCDNGTADLTGDTQNIDLNIDHGKVDIDNETCKNVNVVLDSGMVDIKTNDENSDINMGVDAGTVKYNGKVRVNANFTEKKGTGENKIIISVDKGTISYRNQE